MCIHAFIIWTFPTNNNVPLYTEAHFTDHPFGMLSCFLVAKRMLLLLQVMLVVAASTLSGLFSEYVSSALFPPLFSSLSILLNSFGILSIISVQKSNSPDLLARSGQTTSGISLLHTILVIAMSGHTMHGQYEQTL